MSDKPRFPAAAAKDVARELVRELQPSCEPGRLIVAGSLRRRKAEVGDVEIVYIAKTVSLPDPGDLFGKLVPRNAVDLILARYISDGLVERRLNKLGRETWGEWNKYARHCSSGLPVDFFAATAANWGNYVVCRTGGEETNKAICNAAIERGWHWSPYGEGFRRTWQGEEQTCLCATEEAVFRFAGLDYLEPWERQ